MKKITKPLRKEAGALKSDFETCKEGFNSFIRKSSEPIIVIDKEKTIRYANNAAAKLFNISPEELLGTKFASPLKNGEATDYALRNNNGTEIQTQLHVTKTIWEDRLACVIVFRSKQNIDAQNDNLFQTNTLAFSNSHLSKILESISTAIVSIDENGMIIRANQAVEKLFGYSVSELIGRSVEMLTPHHLSGAADPNIYEFFLKKSDLDTGTRTLGRRNNGSEFPVEVKGSKITVSGKTILTVTMSDITEHENQLRNQRMESIGLLASGIAHDMNNILTPILSASNFLKPYVEHSTATKHLELMSKSAMRGANLIRQLLSFARGNADQIVETELGYLFNDIKHFIEQTFPKTIILEASFPDNLFLVSINPTQLQQVLINLLLNARDAMPEGGLLEIQAENFIADKSYTSMHHEVKEGPYVKVSITDTGIGIPPEQLPKIFEPFFTTKQPGEGTGIGLATTHSIIYNHGGFIRVSSQPGIGTSFTLFVPALLSKTSEKDIAEKELIYKGNNELILVVDDEEAIQEVTADILTANGYRVICASDGSKAVAALARNSKEIKAVILDMMMPVMDGPATVHALRNIKPDIKIIAVSGLMDTDAIGRKLFGDIEEVLKKPYTSQNLLRSLYKLANQEPKKDL